MPAPPSDPAAILRSRSYVGLLLLAAMLGVPISAAAYGYLALVGKLQHWVFTDLPEGLGFAGAPLWWPLPLLAMAGLLVGLTIRHLPGNGGHSPADGFKTGGVASPVELPGIALAALATLGLGAVLGPEAPLIALGGGLAGWLSGLAGRDRTPQATAVIGAAGSFAAISTLLGSPLLGAFLLMEASGLGGPTLGLVLVPGLVAAGVGSLVFVGLDSWTGLGTFSLALPDLPHVGQPTLAEFAWALVIGMVAAVVGTAIRRLALVLRPHVERRLLLATPLVGLAVGGLAVLYARTSGHEFSDVLFSGQDQLGPLVSQSATYSAGVLVLLMACKGLAYSASLAAFRGGPVFPAMFLGAAGGMALSQLPGLTLVPGVAMGIGAMSVVLLRLPMTSVLLATLLLASDGLAVMPLVIVAVAVAYVASARLAPPPREQASKDQPGPLSSSSDDAAPPGRRDDHHDAPPGASTADAAEHGLSGRGGLAMSAFDLDDISNWRGRDVVDQNGHAVGVITDLYVDDATGRPEWAGVKSGLFSHREVFVPLAQATAHGMRVQVPFDHGHIHDAPTIDPDGHLSAEEEARLYEHYGLDYGAADRSGADSEFIAPATDKVEEAPAGGAGRRRLRKHVAAE